MEHTPAPWTYHLGRGANPRFHIQNEGGYQIASTTELGRHSQAHKENAAREANAAFIVRAVNSHEEILTELKRLEATLSGLYRDGLLDDEITDKLQLFKTDTAIAKAEGK